MHCTFKVLEKIRPIDGDSSFTEDEVISAASSTLANIDAVVKSDYSDAYLARLFKNVEKCSLIRAKVL